MTPTSSDPAVNEWEEAIRHAVQRGFHSGYRAALNSIAEQADQLCDCCADEPHIYPVCYCDFAADARRLLEGNE